MNLYRLEPSMIRSFVLFVFIALAAGCQRQSAKEYFELAEQARKSGDAVHALENYRKVVVEFPGDGYAEASQFLVAAILQNDMHDYQEAVVAYKRYAELFPDTKQTPLAMFLTGYIYNNDLKMFDSAGAAYGRFLERFPEHEMASSARAEIQYIGRTPEEILAEHGVDAAKIKQTDVAAKTGTTAKASKKR